MKANRALRWRTMVASHKDLRVSSTLAAQSLFRNKIFEPRRQDSLCKGLNNPDHEQKLQLDGTEEPGFQKTLDCHSDLRNLRGCPRQRTDLDDEFSYGVAIFYFAEYLMDPLGA